MLASLCSYSRLRDTNLTSVCLNGFRRAVATAAALPDLSGPPVAFPLELILNVAARAGVDLAGPLDKDGLFRDALITVVAEIQDVRPISNFAALLLLYHDLSNTFLYPSWRCFHLFFRLDVQGCDRFDAFDFAPRCCRVPHFGYFIGKATVDSCGDEGEQ